MKPHAILCAALLCLGLAGGAQAKEKKAVAPARAAAGSAAAGAASRACTPGDLEGCTAAAERQLAADPGDASFDTERKAAQGTLRTACAGGVQRACSKLADSLERFSNPAVASDDALKIVTLRTHTCEAGDARDCEKLGQDLLERRGVQSPRGAAAALQKACEAKRTSACLRLASLVESGAAGAPDPAAGVKLREKACDLGDAEACSAAADALGRGLASKDAKKVAALDEKSCTLGRGATCWSLSRAALQAGQDKEKDKDKRAGPEASLAWLRKGCDGGDGNSCWELSRLTSAGQTGGPRDDEKALDLMLLACAQGKGGEECRDATVTNLRNYLPPPPPPPPAPPRVHNWVPTLVAAGLTAVAGGAGLQQALQSRSAGSDLKFSPTTDSIAARTAIDTANRRSRVLYATAAGLAAVTVAFTFVF
jgi:TPR repeat protein